MPPDFETEFYLHSFALLSPQVGLKNPSIQLNEVNGTLTEIAIHLAQKTWDELITFCSLGSLRIVILPYMWFNSFVILFQVVSQQTDEFVLLKQPEARFQSETLLLRNDGVEVIAADRSPEVDEVIRFTGYLTLENLNKPIPKKELQTYREGCTELEYFCLQIRSPPVVFVVLLGHVTKAFKRRNCDLLSSKLWSSM